MTDLDFGEFPDNKTGFLKSLCSMTPAERSYVRGVLDTLDREAQGPSKPVGRPKGSRNKARKTEEPKAEE